MYMPFHVDCGERGIGSPALQVFRYKDSIMIIVPQWIGV